MPLASRLRRPIPARVGVVGADRPALRPCCAQASAPDAPEVLFCRRWRRSRGSAACLLVLVPRLASLLRYGQRRAGTVRVVARDLLLLFFLPRGEVHRLARHG